MAWADYNGFATGDWFTTTLMADVKAALQERTGWVGDATLHTAADALAADGWLTAAWFNSCRSIIDNIVVRFSVGPAAVSGANFLKWTKQLLLGHIYDNHGAEASGITYISGTYYWTRVPDRIDTETTGNVVVGDWLVFEWVRAIALAIDHLRYIRVDNDGNMKKTQKDGTDQTSTASAWTSMKAATPTALYTPGTAALQYFRSFIQNRGGIPTQYRGHDYRIFLDSSFEYTYLAGHAFSGFDDGYIRMTLISTGTQISNYKGPFDIRIGHTYTAAGAYTGGSNLADDITVAVYGTSETFTLDNPNNYGTGSSAQHPLFCLQNEYDSADPGEIDRICYPSSFEMLFKPTTAYGT